MCLDFYGFVFECGWFEEEKFLCFALGSVTDVTKMYDQLYLKAALKQAMTVLKTRQHLPLGFLSLSLLSLALAVRVGCKTAVSCLCPGNKVDILLP